MRNDPRKKTCIVCACIFYARHAVSLLSGEDAPNECRDALGELSHCLFSVELWLHVRQVSAVDGSVLFDE